MPCVLNPAQIAEYHQNGLVFARGLFDAEEVGLLSRAMEEDPMIRDHGVAGLRSAVYANIFNGL